jgi:adenylate cyclase
VNNAVSHGYAFGPFILNLQRMSLQRGGSDCALRPKSFNVLRYLVERSGQVVTKDELVTAVWPTVTVSDDALTQCVRDIRKTLGEVGEDYVKTVPRRGYLFAAEVTPLHASTMPPMRPKYVARNFHLAAAALVVLVAFAALGLALLRPIESRLETATSPHHSIAVLPFDEMSGDPELDYFGEGVSNDIISMLARIPDLPVVARSSSFAYKGRAVDIRKVGEELGATHVLEGSVRKEADRIRIVAQLVDARTGQHVWAERFDRTGDDPWALQDEITERIVVALAGHAGMLARAQYREAWGKDSANLQEYDYVLRANALIVHPNPETHRQAMAILREGVSRFPQSGILRVSLAASYVGRHARWWSDSPDPVEDFRQAAALVREPLADPQASPMVRRLGHMVLAFANLTERKFDQALMEAEAAMALSPYDGAMIHWVGEIAVSAGRPQLALEWVGRVSALYPSDDPRLGGLQSIRAWALMHEGELEEALAATSDTRGMLPHIHVMRAIVLSALGRSDEAKKEIETLLELVPSATQAQFRRRFFYLDPEFIEERIATLAAAGLPNN